MFRELGDEHFSSIAIFIIIVTIIIIIISFVASSGTLKAAVCGHDLLTELMSRCVGTRAHLLTSSRAAVQWARFAHELI